MDNNCLRISKKDKNGDFVLSSKVRRLNTAVYGTKGSGKSNHVLPNFAKQDILNHDCGATFIVESKGLAMFLYAMAESNGRNVRLIKPSVNELAWKSIHEPSLKNKDLLKIVDFSRAIKEKEIVIIDMERPKYGQKAVQAIALLLQQFEWGMLQNEEETPHYIYIDNASYYLPFIEDLLDNGDENGIGVTLFLKSRKEMKTRGVDCTSAIDNNVRSIILLNALTQEDTAYFQTKFYDININKFVNRPYNEIIFETIDEQGIRFYGFGVRYELDSEYVEEMRKKSLLSYREMIKNKEQETSKEEKETMIVQEEETMDILSEKRFESVEKKKQYINVADVEFDEEF